MTPNRVEDTVVATLVSDRERLNTLPRFFGTKLVLFEQLVYRWADALCPTYTGGFWDYYTLSNGGFYMALRSFEPMRVAVDGNGYDGTLSADAAGIVCVLFALGELCAQTRRDDFAELYHHLRDFAATHVEARQIYRAID